jgi:hypothetical protein
MRIIALALGSLITLSLVISGGCTSKKERHAEMMVQTPLALDPTDDIVISRWWSNGHELLLLETDGAYTILEGPGRTSAELERGRWSQQNYATLWLEPYSAQTSDRTRVQIARRGNGLALLVPRYADFMPVSSPPVTMEDRVVGRWLGSIGELRLMANHRYELVPADRPGAAAAPGALPPVIQRGTWNVAGDELLLLQEKSTAPPMNLKIVVDDKHVVLNAPGAPGSGGVLTQVK